MSGDPLAAQRAEALAATLTIYWQDGERLRAELARTRAEAADLRAELDRVFASKSWRLTEPLRGVRRRLGHRLGQRLGQRLGR